jgi:hypothetical protein
MVTGPKGPKAPNVTKKKIERNHCLSRRVDRLLALHSLAALAYANAYANPTVTAI